MTSIQFNLLPDVKLQYIKTNRTKKMVISVSLLLGALSLIIFLFLLFSVDVFQKKNMTDLSRDIKTYSGNLQSVPQLNKILTIQGQLSTLPGLHDSKAVSSRTFQYIQQVTPSTATISDLKVDYVANTISITGDAPSLDVVNTFTDTLKFTTYSTSDKTVVDKHAFTGVVLSTFSRSSTSAHFTIAATVDPVIFSNTEDPKLTVPNIQSTRSSVDQPTAIFKQNTSAPATTGTSR
jgi:Tfp pilus assembly protein PilN